MNNRSGEESRLYSVGERQIETCTFLGMAGAKFYRFALRVLRLSDDPLNT